ncbi:MAG: bifunctional [glutamate--ammonia ligase]-adenylyl-L-tyrosine phosphorylase/[glutamate--ammonia-ligase] adenylyltransferase [Thermodesulfobacteriota bacterium]
MTEKPLDFNDNAAAGRLRDLGFSDPRGALRNLRLLSAGPFRGSLDRLLACAARCPSPDGALNNIEAISAALPEGLILDSLARREETIDRLVTVCGSSMYLSNTLARNPILYRWIFAGAGLEGTKDLAAFRRELEIRTRNEQDADSMARALRQYKHKEFLRIGARDLLGISSLEETVGELSDLASAALDAAVEFAVGSVKKAHGRPLCTGGDGEVREAEFAVIGMGKLGGRELNFSSDIDILYLYTSDEGESEGKQGRPGTKTSLHAFFVKVSLLVNRLVSSVTDAGFVFRVDLDLRPEGRSGALANSLPSMEAYYESWGLSWERAAMIKARPVAGSARLGEEFIEMIKPFVYRRYMDFTVIEEIKSMKEKIDLSLLRRDPDAVDVKLGAGGIREIEFYCQALQLIYAGKDPSVRERNTLAAVERLCAAGYMKEADARALRDGYVFLRNLEHRIQIVEGRQSQAIPAHAVELERLARMMGFKDAGRKKAGEFFRAAYKTVTAAVHEIYRSLFYSSGGAGEAGTEIPGEIRLLLSTEASEEESLARLASLGFKDARAALDTLGRLRGGPAFVHLNPRARLRFNRLYPVFLMRVTQSPEPDKALSHLERFISSVGARTIFYSLLDENRKVLDDLVRLFGTSEFLSRALIEQPGGLEQLLSRELATPYRTRSGIFADFSREVDAAPDYEEKLDALRRVKNQEVLRVGVNDISGRVNLRQVCAQMTFVAEAALEASIRIAGQELARGYGRAPGSFCVLGLGKLGGAEMIYGSDLDILFVYSAPEDAKTTGGRQISAHEFYVKLGQRIISALTLRTRLGFVFNVDARLRPSGRPLVLSRSSLVEYHGGQAAVWERQALTRARAVAGEAGFGAEVVRELREAVYSKPLTGEDVDEMLRIRGRMEAEIAKETAERYNIKAGRGGINDIEFLVQALQLRWGGHKRALRTPQTLKALRRIFREGLIPREEYAFLREAYLFLRSLELRQRIVHDRPEGDLIKGSAELTALARRAGYSGAAAGEELLSDYMEYAEKVRKLYLKTLEGLKNG